MGFDFEVKETEKVYGLSDVSVVPKEINTENFNVLVRLNSGEEDFSISDFASIDFGAETLLIKGHTFDKEVISLIALLKYHYGSAKEGNEKQAEIFVNKSTTF